MEDTGIRNKKTRIRLFCLLVVVMLLFAYRGFRSTSRYSFSYLGKGARDITPELSEGIVVTQEIPYTAGSRGLSFQFTTYGHKVSGDISIRVVGEKSGYVYIDRTIPGSDFRNDAFVDFFFPKDIPSEDEKLIVSFSSTSGPTQGLAIMTTHDDSIMDHVLSVNGAEMDTDLMARQIIPRKTYAFIQIINLSKLIIGIAAVYVILLSDIWGKPGFGDFLRKLKKFTSGIPGIVIFSGLITYLWGQASGSGPYYAETAAARYVFVFSLYAILMKHDFLRGLADNGKLCLKKIFMGAVIIGIIVLISFAASFTVRRFGLLAGFSRTKSLMIFCGFFSLTALFLLYIKNKMKIDLMIALSVLIIGSVYAVSYPVTTGVTLDDEIHYERTLQLLHFDKSEISKADYMVINREMDDRAPGLLHDGRSHAFAKELQLAYESNEKIRVPYDLESLGIRLSYLPDAIGLLIGRAFSLSYSWIFILGRWMGTLLYSCLVYISVRQLRSGKVIVFVISMLPMVLFQMSNYTYDAWVIFFPMLAFSRFIGIMQDPDRKMRLIDIIYICVLFFIGFSVKLVYCPLILILLCINRDKLDEGFPAKLYYFIVIFSCVLMAASFIIPFLTASADGVKMGDMRGGSGVDAGQQLSFILSEPLEYTKILLRTLKNYWSIRNLSFGMTYLGYLGDPGLQIPVFSLFILIMLLDKSAEDLYVINFRRKIWMLLLAFAATVLIGTSLYISFTPVRLPQIKGIQIRYVLPILFFLAYYLGDYRLVRPIKKYCPEKILFSIAEIGMIWFSIQALYTCCLSLY